MFFDGNSFGAPKRVGTDGGKGKMKKKKRRRKKKLRKEAIEYDENGHRVVVRDVRRLKIDANAKRNIKMAGKLSPEEKLRKTDKGEKWEEAKKERENMYHNQEVGESVLTPLSPSKHLKQILHYSPAAKMRVRSAERGAKLLVDFRNKRRERSDRDFHEKERNKASPREKASKGGWVQGEEEENMVKSKTEQKSRKMREMKKSNVPIVRVNLC